MPSDSCIVIERTGEIMYGGHITDAWDRRTCNSYLAVLMNEQLFSGLELGPGFASPHPAELDYEGYLTYVEDKLPPGEMEISSLQLSLVAFLTVCLSVCLCVCVCRCLSIYLSAYCSYVSALHLCPD